MRILNVSAVSEYALRCSAQRRAGKFTRVGSDFIEELRVDVENLLRELSMVRAPLRNGDPVELNATKFTTGELSDALSEAVNNLLARMIQNKVQAQPSNGVTLRATR